jgi:hypothetical protein
MSPSKHDEQWPPAIKEAVKQYNDPPATPREKMWQQIQARRQQEKVVRGNFQVNRTSRLLLAAAAVLLAGFLLGRLWENNTSLPQPDTTDTPIVATSDPTPTPTPTPRVLSTAQRLHATNHFNRSSVLLAQFAEAGPEEPLDPELNQWARNLLSNTRLLLDSPMAQDPQYRKLLRDLEFTLAQIVQASTAAEEPEERQWIAGQVNDQSLVERLRLIVPVLPGAMDL